MALAWIIVPSQRKVPLDLVPPDVALCINLGPQTLRLAMRLRPGDAGRGARRGRNAPVQADCGLEQDQRPADAHEREQPQEGLAVHLLRMAEFKLVSYGIPCLAQDRDQLLEVSLKLRHWHSSTSPLARL